MRASSSTSVPRTARARYRLIRMVQVRKALDYSPSPMPSARSLTRTCSARRHGASATAQNACFDRDAAVTGGTAWQPIASRSAHPPAPASPLSAVAPAPASPLEAGFGVGAAAGGFEPGEGERGKKPGYVDARHVEATATHVPAHRRAPAGSQPPVFEDAPGGASKGGQIARRLRALEELRGKVFEVGHGRGPFVTAPLQARRQNAGRARSVPRPRVSRRR
jgi:hypothetical protein